MTKRPATKTSEQIANAIIQRANDGYRDMAKSGYPPFALTPWDDRNRWSAYIKKVAAEVISQHMKGD